MTGHELLGHVIAVAWCFAAVAFLGFVWTCVLLTRWHKREDADQADTDKRLVQTKPQQDRLADAILALINRPS